MTKAAIVFSVFSFTNCCGYSFMLIFLNFEFYYIAVEYKHKYLNTQHINIRKNLCFIVCTTVPPEEPQSVMRGLRVSVQLAKPALPIRSLCEQLPKVCVFFTRLS